MKYSAANPPLQCFMRQSTWYKGSKGSIPPKGVLIHSTGANNPNVKRYVQPDDNAPDREKLLKIIGVNYNGNDWNHIYREAGVHGFTGKLADGTVSTVQTGPLDKPAWGCGPGKYGSCNSGWVQIEICEDALTDPAYFQEAYTEAAEFTAYVCKTYGLDPFGTVLHCGVQCPVILCHQDSYQYGLGCNHSDVYNWFPKFNKTMDDFRNDVAALIADAEKEDEVMEIYKNFEDIPDYYQDAIKKLVDKDALKGGGNGLFVSDDFCRTMTVLDRLGKLD